MWPAQPRSILRSWPTGRVPMWHCRPGRSRARGIVSIEVRAPAVPHNSENIATAVKGRRLRPELQQMTSRPLGKTGLAITPIGFGAFKIGRNEKTKYGQAYALPDRSE